MGAVSLGAAIVAIPVRNEMDRIVPCLLALARQTVPPAGVVLLLNNCTDSTQMLAASLAPALPFSLRLESVVLPPPLANAGHARRLAMKAAAIAAGPNGILLTTDADAIVPDRWVEKNLHAITLGAEAVCGCIDIDPSEAALIPGHLHADDARECMLIGLLDEIASVLDPDPADPWPCHSEASGASLAVTVAAYRRAGGIPAIQSGEDRAFIGKLALIDARIRHDPAIRVLVSARIDGRAPGGMADTIRRRIGKQDEFTDERAEYPGDAYRRADMRRRARSAWLAVRNGRDPAGPLAADLAIPPASLTEMLRTSAFGQAWATIEAGTPVLARRRVRFAELPKQIAFARHLVTHAMGRRRPCLTGWRVAYSGHALWSGKPDDLS